MMTWKSRGSRLFVVTWWRVVRHVGRLNSEKHLGLIAAGVAFYAILAVFPGMAATIALWGIVGDPGLALSQIEEFSALLPSDVYSLLTAQLRALIQADGLTLGWASIVSFGFAIWSARAGVAALMQGLNAIYDAPNRSGLAHYLRALLLTFALIGVVLIAMASIVLVPIIMAFFPLGRAANFGVEFARWGVGITVLLVGFSLIYRWGPNVADARPSFLSPGAAIALICWLCASTGFSVYLQNFGNYNEVYGSLGAVIVMLLWLFISAYLVLLGGALNAELSRLKNAKAEVQNPDSPNPA